MSVNESKLPLREERIQKIAAAIAGVPWHEWTRPFYIHPRRDALLKEAERVDNMLSFEPSQQSFDAPTTYAPATDNEVKVALAEYHDAEEYNSDEVNMKAAIDAVLYLRGSTEQAFGDT